MIETPVGLIDSLLKFDSSQESKRSGKRSGKTLTQRAKNQKSSLQSTRIQNSLILLCRLLSFVHNYLVYLFKQLLWLK